MIIVPSKYVYQKLWKNCTIQLRFRSAITNKLENILVDAMPQNRKAVPLNKGDMSLGFVGLEVLGNTSRLSPCGVSLNTPNRSYLFNCGEGMQKVMMEYKIKTSKYQDIFITFPSWKNLAGYIGTALSMQESNIKSVVIHGHPCLDGLFETMKYIVNFKGIKQSLKVCEHSTEFSDEFISVKFVHIHKDKSSASVGTNKNLTELVSDECTEGGTSTEKGDKIKSGENNFSGLGNVKEKDSYLNESSRNKQDYAISFIVHTEKSFGSLSFEKCVDLGVPVGPLLGKLKRGEDVQLQNGKIIKSSDVKLPDTPGVIVIVVECPSEEYLDSLLKEHVFFEHESNNMEYYDCAVVHFSSSAVVNHKKYQEWLNRFSADTKHIFVNETSEISGYVGSHRNQFKLNMVHSEIFPQLHTFGLPEYPRAENCIKNEGVVVKNSQADYQNKNASSQIYSDKVYYKCEKNMHIYGETLCEIPLKPKRDFDYSKCLTLKKNEYMEEVLAHPNFRVEFAKYKEKMEKIGQGSKLDKKMYPKIVFLGTGSKKPSKTRNSSGILVFLNEEKSIILDCGENTYCQLLTFFGTEKTKEVLRSLGAIFISHLHIDHHLGLTTLLLERKQAFNDLQNNESDPAASNSKVDTSFKPITVIVPVQMRTFLHYLSNEIVEISDLYSIIPSTGLTGTGSEKNYSDLMSDLNLEFIKTTFVDHTSTSFGMSMKHLDGWKLTYSGDTRPCESLVQIGKDSDVLIHEATFDDIFESEAKEKLHSTTGQAILIGRKMNAKFIFLTHFSQRYCHLPMITNKLLQKRDVGVAFDFMQVSPYQYHVIPYLYEPIKLAFTVYQERLEHVNSMLKIKRERDKTTESLQKSISEMDVIPSKIFKTEKL